MMNWLIAVFLINSLLVLFPLNSSGGICGRNVYAKRKTAVRCYLWGWFTCTEYKTVQVSRRHCCKGWTHFHLGCRYAICGGKTNLNKACQLTYTDDKIIYRGGQLETFSNGRCIAPNSCANCNDGFFNDTIGHCSICPKIDHCKHRRCTAVSDNHCEYCDGEIKKKLYWRAYTRHKDSLGNEDNFMKNCIQACSWRKDSTRCYPGRCDNEIAASCECNNGFGGKHCQTILRDTTIAFASAKFKSANPTDDPIETPEDPNYPIPRDTTWTNKVLINQAMLQVTSNFKVNMTAYPPSKTGDEHFITEFKYGITKGLMKLTLIREGNTTIDPIILPCRVDKELPTNDVYPCIEPNVQFTDWNDHLPFQHEDIVIFSLQILNGGYLKYIDRDTDPDPVYASHIRVELNGRNVTREFIVQWDIDEPYHQCVQENGSKCTSPPISVEDVTNKSVIHIDWNSWFDDLSTIDSYSYEVFELEHNGRAFSERTKITEDAYISKIYEKSNFTVTSQGMYSVVFTAVDKAGNEKSCRTLFLYDDSSIVEVITEKHIIVKQSSKSSNNVWVDVDDPLIHVHWPGKFKNERHHAHMWLDNVLPRFRVDSEYDDHYGKRQTTRVPNVQGIVRFETEFTVYSPNASQYSDFNATKNVLDESASLSVTWNDGDMLIVTVRAFDIFENYKEDTVTVYKDASPPEIRNLWLTRGDRVNISVHSIEDFSKMIIKWEAYDYHSGLYSLSWRLYDNFTGINITHGHDDLHTQGDFENLTTCEKTYHNTTGGQACYCTIFHGCFHKTFHVKPAIVKGAGLDPFLSNGVHDSDYFIEVSVVNKAKLRTVVAHKITIDISPPHEGSVHDGLKGDPEVDYQQHLHLHAHWEGFFDRESGVKSYLYTFSNRCVTREEFKNISMVNLTYNTYASFVTSVEGTYYASVVAVNRANENSNVVCSDGVTITTDVPYVTEISVEGAKSRPRLVKDGNGTIWLLSDKMTRHFIQNKTDTCKIFPMPNVTIFPEGSIVDTISNSICHFSTNNDIIAVVAKTSQLKMTWKSAVNAQFVYDYQIGLSSTAKSVAPDIVYFRSTKHHEHFRLNHPNVPDGREFHIIMKTISKSGVVGIQSIGPFIIDTTKPKFTGIMIDVTLKGNVLVANWSEDSFTDLEDPYPLQFQYAFGHQQYKYDLQHFQNLQHGGPCKMTIPPTCTVLPISKLKWSLHGHHEYYFTVKATNVVGLSVLQSSVAYNHNVQRPSEGMVFDISSQYMSSRHTIDIEDIDFTVDTASFAVSWTGFLHPYENVSIDVCLGTIPGICDVVPWQSTNYLATKHLFSGLSLMFFKMYYATVKASTPAGSVNVTSDGVRVLDITTKLKEIVVRDGNNCTGRNELKSSHHYKDTRPVCIEDVDYQSSVTTFSAYWNMPTKYHSYFHDSYMAIEERWQVGDFWENFHDYIYVGTNQYATIGQLDMKAGRFYRAVVKLCAEEKCFPNVSSNAIAVIYNHPVTGEMSVNLIHGPNNTDLLKIKFDKFYDPDIVDRNEAISVIGLYEWTIGDDLGMHTKWNEVLMNTVSNLTQICFEAPFNGSVDFSKCRKIFVRGYNKAGIWSVISKEIKQCIDKALIVPNIVIDAVGEPELYLDGSIRDGFGQEILLAENNKWEVPDTDYTPYVNIISALWPTLRHKNYTWAVLDSENLYKTGYLKNKTMLNLVDPCSHPSTIKCGHTDKTYINVNFKTNEILDHGKWYIVCIHAPRIVHRYEKWNETFPEISACSDGITVDMTPPRPGNVWIGLDSSERYQTSTSDLYVSWDSFIDVEEYGQAVHSSGIKEYQVGLGSINGGTDVAAYLSVGIVNHFTFNNLRLQNGHEYYATVKAIDFSRRSAIVNTQPVKIDNTAPQKSSVAVHIQGRHLTDLSAINACWTDVFTDMESGIDHFLWAIGSHPGDDNIIPFTATTLDCGISAEDTNIDIHEGHQYFITVKAVNRAKLVAMTSSWAFIFDMSPPIAGYVYDSNPDSIESKMRDVDYQTNLRKLSVYWDGFYDSHSTIKSYYVSVGTCSGCQDVLRHQGIGIVNNFTLCHIHLGPAGIRYFTTITACNTADLCTSVTSDGVIVDNSPPTKGVVIDGVDIFDLEYQSLRNYISAKWYGFSDSQSGLESFAWRAGTKPGYDDLIKTVHLPVTNILVEPNLQQNTLPLGERIYITITAYNKAGLSVESTSNGFLIDDSLPVINVKPFLSRDLGSIVGESIIFRSTLKVKWEVDDRESFIQRQYLSLTSHEGGEFNSTSIEICGMVREYTFARLDVHDGSKYTIKLIACNGAKLCVESESSEIMVDSSPPTPGMFAINTDHAANLHRHVNEWMSWSQYKLWLSWLGFTDLHTGIDSYYVSVGSQYMLNDLNKDVFGSPAKFQHNSSEFDKGDEGFVQTFAVETKNLGQFDNVFISVWAVNKVGLQSPIIHSQFKLVPGGSLHLVRRCSALTCLGHCVCAAQGQRCSLNGTSCNIATLGNKNSILGVYDLTNVDPTSNIDDKSYTPSNDAIASKWKIVQAQGLLPLWFEWSAGLSIGDTPQGIFDNLNDNVWHHAGQNYQAILNLKRGKVLKEYPVSYSMFIRAWYDENTYAQFKTDGVQVMSKPLSTRTIRGTAVVEQIPGGWKKDIDYIKPGAPFTINWSNVFKDASKVIEYFKVYISTNPGGHDIHEVDKYLPGHVVALNISRISLTPGKIYYCNVIGYSHSGIHKTQSSDGIMTDSVPPVPGTIYDGIGLYDIDYTNSSDSVGGSWHGFADSESGISNFMWCVQTQDSSESCDIRKWESVGIHHSMSKPVNISHQNIGKIIKNLVYAVDLNGQESETTSSNGFVIDKTSPELASMEHLDQNLAHNPSFEDVYGEAIDWKNITNTNFCDGTESIKPKFWNITIDSCIGVLKSDRNIAFDGRSFIYVKGEISQILNIKTNHLYRVTFVSAHPPVLGAVLANKEGYIQLNHQTHVFIVYTKRDKDSIVSTDTIWHRHTFYFRSVTNKAVLRLGSMTGNTGILIDNVEVQQVNLHTGDYAESSGKQVHSHFIALHQWSSIHASWGFVDAESPVIDYMWAIGYSEGSTEIQAYTSVGLNNFAYNYNVPLAHTSLIHITVIATNAAGLTRKAHAEDFLVDLTPPIIMFINDGLGVDLDAQSIEEISANWEVKDQESGIEICDFAVGYQPYGNEIQTFKKIPGKTNSISKLFPSAVLSMQTIHVTIRCRNRAGLQSTLSTDGIKISNLPPDILHAEITILPHSVTEYNCFAHYQGDMSSVRLRWTGFEDIAGLDSYTINFQNIDRSLEISKSVIYENQDVMYCVLDGLKLTEGNYTVLIRAVNRMYLRSGIVDTNVGVTALPSSLTGSPSLDQFVTNNTVTVSWTNHFQSQQPIFYEVSAGTKFGGADIIQWQETKNTFIEFEIPLKIKLTKGLKIYLTIRGISANGMTRALNAVVKI